MREHIQIHTGERDRDVYYNEDVQDRYVEIRISGKEAMDLLNAVQALVEDAESGMLDTDLPVEDALNITRGSTHFPDRFEMFIASIEYAETYILALERYEPDECDFTSRLQTVTLEVLEEVPLGYDVDSLRDLVNGN